MSRVNIPSTIEDPAYRYTMPVMKLKQVSRLNGVKTDVTNLPDVAAALRVPESAVLKYFCAEVGANSEGTSIVKGQHTQESFRVLLDKFIKRYVCCAKCNYPELAYQIQGKKDLMATCNACGNAKSMDVLHKAGKQMFNEIQKHPDLFRTDIVKPVNNQGNEEEIKPSKPGKKPRAKKNQQAVQEALEEAKLEEQKADNKARVEKIMEEGGEVNILDAKVRSLADPEIESAIEDVNKMIETTPSIDDLLKEVRHAQLILNITPDYKYYILICGIFNLKRNIVKHWPTYEKVFLKLVQKDGELGPKRLFQAVILFFINKYPEQKKYASRFCKLLYDNSMYTDEFFTNWHGNELRLDKNCVLHDKKAEKQFKALIDDFVEWLQYGEEEDPDENAAQSEEDPDEQPKDEETEAQLNQRLLIEAQKKAQTEKMAAAKLESEKQKQVQDDEEEKVVPMEEVKTKNIAQIEVEDNFDIADI